MILFEKMRDQLLNEKVKYQNDNMTEEQKEQMKQQQLKKNRTDLKEIYRSLIRKFNMDYKALKWSQLLLQDMVNQKLKLEPQDYENLISAHRMNPAHVIRIYKNITAEEGILVDPYIMKQFFRVISVNGTEMADFFEKMLRDYIFSHRMQLSIGMVLEAAKVFLKIKNNTLFTEFIDFLLESDLQFNHGNER